MVISLKKSEALRAIGSSYVCQSVWHEQYPSHESRNSRDWIQNSVTLLYESVALYCPPVCFPFERIVNLRINLVAGDWYSELSVIMSGL